MTDFNTWIPHVTEDGSITFFSEEFGEAFHSRKGAKEEALVKSAAATDLAELARQGTVRLLDVCYGLGYNTAAALETIWTVNPTCQVEMFGLELDPTVPLAAIQSSVGSDPTLAPIGVWSLPVQEVLKALALEQRHHDPRLQATLLMGDARQTIQKLVQQGFQADAIFFDPFSPRRCPQLWTVEFFQQVVYCLAPTGKLATYSRSAAVRAALLAVGLCVGTLPIAQPHLAREWSQGTIAAHHDGTLIPLSLLEQEHLKTRAAIPYRDPYLRDSATTILSRHQQEQQQCSLESTSSWRRRWGIQ